MLHLQTVLCPIIADGYCHSRHTRCPLNLRQFGLTNIPCHAIMCNTQATAVVTEFRKSTDLEAAPGSLSPHPASVFFCALASVSFHSTCRFSAESAGTHYSCLRGSGVYRGLESEGVKGV